MYTQVMKEEPHLLSSADVLLKYRVKPEEGLSKKAVARHRKRYGSNELPRAHRRHPLWLIADRLTDTLVLILVGAVILSLALGHYADAAIITAAILLDVTMGLTQVWKTEKTLEKLRSQVQPSATVIRGGQRQRIPARELVVGDIIELRAGERVGADARLITTEGLRTVESALTGESDDIEKSPAKLNTRTPVSNRKNMVFMGTAVASGSATAVVTTTGTSTQLGKIAQVLKATKSQPSPLARKLRKVGLQIGIAIVGAVSILAATGIMMGQDLAETSLTAVTLIVSAIPEDLTVILTIALTVGVTRILRHNGAVRQLRSGETLGAATVICTDKTGTLTLGEMQAQCLNFTQGDTITREDPQINNNLHKLALTGMLLATDARRARDGTDGQPEYIGEATERASLAFAEWCGLNQEQLKRSWRQRDAITFNPRWKYQASLHDHPTQSTRYMFVTGAPEVLLRHSSRALNQDNEPAELTSSRRWEIRNKITASGRQGLRLIGVAVRRNMNTAEITRDEVEDLLFLGFLTIRDPVREDVLPVIQETARAGVDVKLVTGDMAETAQAVGVEVGIISANNKIVTSEDMEQMTDEELRRIVGKTSVFARVTPLDKQRLIKALKKEGHVVAMTGDGINDAVALKEADIGVAMGSGRDIAKEAADLVLLDDKFTTIVQAIKEGRVVRDNLRKVMGFLLATNAAEVAIFLVSLVARAPLPLLPAQILWINLVTDGTSDVALALEPAESNVMKRKPEDPADPLLGKSLLWHIVFTGIVLTAATMILYWYLLAYTNGSMQYVRTMVFTLISFVSLLSVWSFRSLRESIFRRGFRGNKWIPVSLAISAGLHLVAVYTPGLQPFFSTVPLSLRDWALIIIASAVSLIIIDLRKIPISTKAWLKASSVQPASKASS